MLIFGRIDSTILTKLSLSKGGGGWKKNFFLIMRRVTERPNHLWGQDIRKEG